MMTTCRLLCALLVLALCCCPSVCMTTSDVTPVSDASLESTRDGTSEKEGKGQMSSAAGEAGRPGSGKEPDLQKSIGEASPKLPTKEGDALSDPLQGANGQSPKPNTQQQQGDPGSTGSSRGPAIPSAKGDPDTLNGNDGEAATQRISGPASAKSEHPSTKTTTAQENGENVTEGSQSSSNPSTNQRNKKADDSTETSTTATTNERTPTTTTAPEAPSTTTTEAPTTTTTGAPSRLPEIDGSLSSSAWVCAPLLLAVSALAYTTLG
ncbi:mucin TcMUCII, putative [Trypanosoma cruzi marinkellei]|uniref:Mucin TcMUCII, putative n=1 Tax=Trypanosoma cruzi marinkellei TaxID=85056 RepID=K2MQE8_TRYCR|nr:mucin TcMUCII, putative [Trypanosoma cruzi marinkellei]